MGRKCPTFNDLKEKEDNARLKIRKLLRENTKKDIEYMEDKKESKVDGGGMRFNSNKAELHQVPTSVINGIAKVLMYGAQKYEKGNFRRGMKWTTPYDCLTRHMMLWLDGEELDEESGLPHLYHAAANIAMLIEFAETCPELDDRFKGEVNSYKDSFAKHEFKAYGKNETNIREEDLDDMEKEFADREFKVGDRVRRINVDYFAPVAAIRIGDIVTISGISENLNMISVEEYNVFNIDFAFELCNFELVK